MQMRTSGAARTAHFCDFRAAQNHLADFDVQLRCMRVTRNQLITVVNFHHITIRRMVLRVDHHTARRREYGRADTPGKIDALVQGVLSGKGVDAPAVIRVVAAA